nr:hypothetical protein [Bradyrhizobium sp. CCBAU 11386]
MAGAPELRHRDAVQIDGNISLPLVGTLAVVGLPFCRRSEPKSWPHWSARCFARGLLTVVRSRS